MTLDQNNPNGSTRTAGRPFPWHCPRCRQKTVNLQTIPFETERWYEGQLYQVKILELSVPVCSNCGEVVFNQAAEDQVNRALRSQLPRTAQDSGASVNGFFRMTPTTRLITLTNWPDVARRTPTRTSGLHSSTAKSN
jgi:hypothetical protein